MSASTNNSTTKTTNTAFGHRLALAAAVSCLFSMTLALLFACVTFMGETQALSPRALLLPGVLPTALLSAGVVALVMMPLAFWSVRTGETNLRTYGTTVGRTRRVHFDRDPTNRPRGSDRSDGFGRSRHRAAWLYPEKEQRVSFDIYQW